MSTAVGATTVDANERFARRVERLIAALRDKQLDALLVTDRADVRYLSNFSGSNGTLVVGHEHRVLVTDFRYTEQARAEVRGGFEVVEEGQDMARALARLVSGRVAFDEAQVTVRSHRRLREAVGEGVELVPVAGLVAALRKRKDEGEVAAIAAAAELADTALRRVLEQGVGGRSESELSWELERAMRELGAEGLAFPPIVAFAAHAALPHAQPRRDARVEGRGLLLFDWGAKLDGYCSDCTRTFAVGAIGSDERSVYELVLEAQRAALAEVRVGKSCAELDRIARTVIEEAGYGDRFGHGLGHGIGLEVHEEPRLSRAGEGELEGGEVVTIEPGVYLPGRFGVRIEDLVVVEGDSPRVLSGIDKELTEID
ncbi:Aminopeptidase YpdF [bacterium HR41]|nr:Aminopeptidase YpdF [bacterium HR41]